MNGFFSGRYGLDDINKTLIGLFLLFSLLGNILRMRIFVIIGTIILCYAFFRMMSKNIDKRQRENQKFISMLYKMKKKNSQRLARKNDKAHNFFKCPHCKKYMSVPKGVGKVSIICANCKTKFIRNSK